ARLVAPCRGLPAPASQIHLCSAAGGGSRFDAPVRGGFLFHQELRARCVDERHPAATAAGPARRGRRSLGASQDPRRGHGEIRAERCAELYAAYDLALRVKADPSAADRADQISRREICPCPQRAAAYALQHTRPLVAEGLS